MNKKPLLSIFGAGKVGKTLGRLWLTHDCVTIGEVFTRNIQSAKVACEFIGQGTPRHCQERANAADIWLITCPDAAIEQAAKKIQTDGGIGENTIVLHCAGNSSSDIIAFTGRAASVHPVHAFANPEKSLQQFVGSFCAAEGDETALAIAKSLFERIGARWLPIQGTKKNLYHAATVTASNHLTALIDQALRLAQSAGLDLTQSQALLAPLAQNALHNVLTNSAAASLTGPISRGDTATVASHIKALENFNGEGQDQALYHALAKATLRIAKQQALTPERLNTLEALLNPKPSGNSN